VALGDSYAAGVGSGPDNLAPDSTADCGRSVFGWPVVINKVISNKTLTPFDNETCSGAKIADVRANQLQALTKDTTLVTVMIGGNDMGFSSLLRSCMSASCAGVIQQLNPKLPALQANLTDLYKDIRSRAPAALVVVVGYPQIFDAPIEVAGVTSIYLLTHGARIRASFRVGGGTQMTCMLRHPFACGVCCNILLVCQY
jgi:lysophospholipase L1-like esterase